MIYLVAYDKKHETRRTDGSSRGLLFIEGRDGLVLDQMIALVTDVTEGDFEESSVEIIGQKDWDAAKIKIPGITFHKLS